MGRPRLIILIRHAQSEGNKNRSIHQTIPDHRVRLTPTGHEQALEAGERLKDLLLPTDKIQVYTSPYRRTRETTANILQSLGNEWKDKTIVYEEPRIREQDFGNFQPCSYEMSRMWDERAAYGHFFYRIPDGESAADAYDRVSGFNESLWRQFSDPDCPSVIVLVTHGLMTRIFLMKWYHYSVEYFEDLRNIDHCEFVIMRRNESNKYTLENKLRTWSELKAEQDALALSQGISPIKRRLSSVSKKELRFGCAGGCNHGKDLGFHIVTDKESKPAVEKEKKVSLSEMSKDKSSIEKATRSNLKRNLSFKSSGRQPTIEISGDSSSSEEVIVDRGRDGGGSKSGFNSDDECGSDGGIDSDIENREAAEIEKQIETARAEKLGDVEQSDTEDENKHGDLTPLVEDTKHEPGTSSLVEETNRLSIN